MIRVTRKDFIRYAVLPGFKPRLQELFTSGFHYIPYFIALVYQAVRLLPNNHPYLNPENIGRYGIRHVVAEAANNLVINRKNIDQIVLFIMIMLGLVIIFIQLGLLVVSLMAQPVMAATTNADLLARGLGGFFLTPTNTAPHDLALIMLDMVFGVPGLFGSCVDPAAGTQCLDISGTAVLDSSGQWILQGLGWPFPAHEALHQMFSMYSEGLLVVAALIAFYFIVTVIAETAQSGTPFGKRFNKVWAPLRIVVAFGLLIPVGYGLNSSQYLVLYAAKFGSGFATNGWVLFNDVLNTEAGGVAQTLVSEENNNKATNMVSQPGIPEVGGLLQFLYVARTCAEVECLSSGGEPGIGASGATECIDPNPGDNIVPRFVEPFLVKDPKSVPNHEPLAAASEPNFVSYEDMIAFINPNHDNPNLPETSNQALIRFGVHSPENYPNDKGNVEPICGELVLRLSDSRHPNNTNNSLPEKGPEIMQRYYWFIINELWFYTLRGLIDMSGNMPFLEPYVDQNYPLNTAIIYQNAGFYNATVQEPPPEYRTALQQFYSQDLENAMLDPTATGLQSPLILNSNIGSIEAQVDSGSWAVDPVLKQKGWAGAGLWYNKIAELNGIVTTAVLNIPTISRYPEVQEEVLAQKKLQNQTVSIDERYKPTLADDDDVKAKRPEDKQIAQVLWQAFKYWQEDGSVSTSHTSVTGNQFIDAIKALLGTEGLYSMRRNPNVHPLAQLVGIGRSLIESSIRTFAGAGATSAAGAALSTFDKAHGGPEFAETVVGFFMMITMIGLTVGFILFYIVPFMPFIYFFFAVGGWVKGIFEAMVGAPLWALAHIRIDGNGLPGQAAVNGYFLIFEIFLRPILIVFGLLASISIFSALVSVLNMTWELVLSNLTGFDVRAEITGVDSQGNNVENLKEFFRNPVDQFFFTVVYAIIVYLMAMSSFKLIDLIPNNILRWMGQSVATFNDQRENPAEGLVGKATIGSQQVSQTVGGGVGQLLGGIANPAKHGGG